MKLKSKTIKTIRQSRALKRALIDYFDNSGGCNESTFYRYLRTNSPRLIEYPALEIISSFLRKPIKELVIKHPEQ